LIRVAGGWKRPGLSEEEGAWDRVYQKAKAHRAENKEAQQAGSSNGG